MFTNRSLKYKTNQKQDKCTRRDSSALSAAFSISLNKHTFFNFLQMYK